MPDINKAVNASLESCTFKYLYSLVSVPPNSFLTLKMNNSQVTSFQVYQDSYHVILGFIGFYNCKMEVLYSSYNTMFYFSNKRVEMINVSIRNTEFSYDSEAGTAIGIYLSSTSGFFKNV
jgi:hypothetical protein